MRVHILSGFPTVIGRGALFFLFVFLLLAQCPGFAQAADLAVRDIWKSGDVTITAIQDLPGSMPMDIFKGPASDTERAKYFKEGKTEAGFNVFLMRVADKIVLFDSGNGDTRKAPGKLIETLGSLGLTPDAVDLVLLTHMHMDHIGGLIADGQKAFPNAKLMVSAPELDYWLKLAKQDPANANAVLVEKVAGVYGQDLLPPFAFGDTLLPGVTALDAVGHTPGHTVFQVEADGKRLLILGDLLHGVPLQLALPEECAIYDLDMPAAVAARKRILDLAAKENIAVAGMHLPFPGEGMILKEGAGYRLEKR